MAHGGKQHEQPDPREFAQIFSEAVARRDLTLDSLATRLRMHGTPVSTATLSYWQNGRTIPTRGTSLRAVGHLERILQVAPGHLLSALPQTGTSTWHPNLVVPRDATMQRVLTAMGLSLEHYHTPVVHLETLVIGDDNTVQRHTLRQLIRSEVDGRLSWPVVYKQESGGGEAPWVLPTGGCELLQGRQVPELGLFVGELALHREVTVGEMVSLEFEVIWSSRQQYFLSRALHFPVQFLAMDVIFHGQPPAMGRHAHTPSFHDDDTPTHTPMQVHGNSLQLVLNHAPAGVHAVEWSWDESPERMGSRPPWQRGPQDPEQVDDALQDALRSGDEDLQR